MSESIKRISRTTTRACAWSHFLAGGAHYLPGTVLLVAGVLKLQQYLAGSVIATVTSQLPHRFLFPIAMVEILLAAYLLLGGRFFWSWFASLTLFCSLFTFNVIQLARGQSDCECFGQFSMSPWITLIIDGVCIWSLCKVGRSLFTTPILRSFLWIPVFVGLAIAIAIFSNNASTSWLHVNDLWATVVPNSIDASPQQKVAVKVKFQNSTNSVIHILGKRGACGLKFDADFPLRLEPGCKLEVNSFFTASKVPRNYMVPAVLITDSPVVPAIIAFVNVRVSLNVKEPSNEPK